MFCSRHATYDYHNAPSLTQPICPMNVITLHLSDTSKTIAFVRAHVHFYTETLIRYVLQHTCNIWLSQLPRSDTANMPHKCHHIALVRLVWNASISENRRTFYVLYTQWRAGASACGTNPSNPLIVKTKQNSLRYAQRGCLNVWFVRNTPMAIFGPWKWRLDGPYIYKTYILANS